MYILLELASGGDLYQSRAELRKAREDAFSAVKSSKALAKTWSDERASSCPCLQTGPLGSLGFPAKILQSRYQALSSCICSCNVFVENCSASRRSHTKSISCAGNVPVSSHRSAVSRTGLRGRQAPARSRAATSTACCTPSQQVYTIFTGDRIIHRDLKPENILLTEAKPVRES